MNKKLLFQHKLGYALGDLGGCITFGIMGSFLLPYYTEVVGITAASVGTLFFVAKIWDAVNNLLMGAILDKRYEKVQDQRGKFRPYILLGAPLVAITAVSIFGVPAEICMNGKLVWVYVTYITYGMCYTFLTVPYGSLFSAMAITADEKASLSSARSIGGLLGSLLPLMLFPGIISVMSDKPRTAYFLGISIMAVMGLIFHLLCYKYTEERTVQFPKTNTQVQMTDILAVVKRNRAFVGISIIACAIIFTQTIINTLSVYYFRDNLKAFTMIGIAKGAVMLFSLVALTITPKVVKKNDTEKTVKACIIIGIIISAALFLFSDNLWLYIIFHSIGMMFLSIPAFMQWGMLGDVIDYNEYLMNKRSEGAIFGSFNFCRRIGQAAGASLGAFAIGIIGYIPNAAVQPESVLRGIRIISLGAPVFGGIIIFITFKFIWNINDELRKKITVKK